MTTEDTMRVVEAWYDHASRGEWERIPGVAGPAYTRHEPDGTRVVTGDEYAAEIRDQLQKRGVLRWEPTAFADGDMAFVTLVARGTPTGDISTVQAFRVADGKLVETWISAIAPVAWPRPAPIGPGDPDANKRLLRRWYDEVHEQRRFAELTPQFCAPIFTLHDATGTFDFTAEEHGQRLADAVAARDAREGRTPLVAGYRAFSAGDGIGVIATAPGSGPYVQAWRVENGKFVETWWAGFAQASW